MTVQPIKSDPKSQAPWTVRRIIEWTTTFLSQHQSETPRLDTEILLAHARGCQRIELYTHFDDVLSDTEREIMRELVRRRAQAEPVAYLVGHREFYSLDFRVTPDVLIPRPDTETLVMELLERAAEFSKPRILEIGTGSGCVAVTAAVHSPEAQIIATDISEAALSVARENAAGHNVSDRIDFRRGDLFEPIPGGEQFDLIVSNPPYVTEAELQQLQADVRLHEPHLALDGGPDGLRIVRRLIESVPGYLTGGGFVLLEIASEQSVAVREMFESQAAYTRIRTINDLAGKLRVVQAQAT